MKNLQYILMVLLGGTLYGTMSSFVKLSYSHGYTAADISFVQAALAALFLWFFALASRNKQTPHLTGKEFFSLLLTGSFIGLTNYLYYQSVNFISASLAIVILMQFTWISLVLDWILFGKKPTQVELITVFFILTGTIMASGLINNRAWLFSVKGVMLVLAASLTYAAYIVANGRKSKNVRWQAKSMLIMTGSALTIFLINSRSITPYHYLSSDFMLWALFFAVLGTTIPTALFAVGIPRVGTGLSSILMTIELPVAIICASVVLNEKINLLQTVGIVVMLVAIAAMNYYKSLKESNNQSLKHSRTSRTRFPAQQQEQ